MEKEEKVFELNPLKKWKRIVLSLGDYFITFIISFVLFNLAVFPLAKLMMNTQERNAEVQRLEKQSNSLLIDSGILIAGANDTTFDEYVNHTFKVFLSYYAFDEENPSVTNPDYGRKIKNEVIRTYYLNIKNDENSYISLFKEANSDGLFAIGDTVSSIVLKDEYKLLLSNELLEITDESQYSTNMLNFRDHVFARLFYLDVYKDIQANDLVVEGVSYNQCLAKAKSIMLSLQWIASISVLISIVLAWGVVYLLVPLLNSERRTITMSVMKLDKLKMAFFAPIDKKIVLIQSFYYLILALSPSAMLPVLFFGLGYSFNLPLLFVLSAISLFFAIVSLFFILFNQYNRSGSDILTRTLLVETDELDRLYRETHNE